MVRNSVGAGMTVVRCNSASPVTCVVMSGLFMCDLDNGLVINLSE